MARAVITTAIGNNGALFAAETERRQVKPEPKMETLELQIEKE
jgi:hypothetical protein